MSCIKALQRLIWILKLTGTSLLVTCAVTSYWRGKDNYHEGVFETCASKCSFVLFFHGDLDNEVPRLLMIAGMGFLAIAMFLYLIAPCAKKNLSFALAIIDTTAFSCCCASLSFYFYSHQYLHPNHNYSFLWSYWIGWSGCIAFGFGLLFQLWAACTEKNDEETFMVEFV